MLIYANLVLAVCSWKRTCEMLSLPCTLWLSAVVPRVARVATKWFWQDWALVKIVVLPAKVKSVDWTGHRLATGLENGEVRVLNSQFRCGALEEAWLG